MTSMNVWVLIGAVTLALLALVFVIARTNPNDDGAPTGRQRARRKERAEDWARNDEEREEKAHVHDAP